MKYIDADKIRAEIERRMETCDATSKTPNQLLWAELGALIAFIDTLEEPVGEDMEEAADKYSTLVFPDGRTGQDMDRRFGFIAGAKWQEKRFENNRLMAQDHATEGECQREMDFVDNHIKKHHRIPTFSDAINYGIEWQKKQMPLPEDTLIFKKGVEEGKRLMMEEAVEGEVYKFGEIAYVKECNNAELTKYLSQFDNGDKVRIIILPKEDKK